MRHLRTTFFTALFVLGTAGFALASEGEGLPWGNFALRLLNVAIFLAIIWFAAGKLIKSFIVGRKEKIANTLVELENLKKQAVTDLKDIENRVANIESECAAMMEEGRRQAEKIREAILAEAEKQAAQIIEAARMGARQEAKAEYDAIRARLADEIAGSLQQKLAARLDAATQEHLMDKALSKIDKVVLQ